MNKLRVLELFGGIGACSKALEKLGIDYEIADYVEIDKYAVKSFNAIHNTNFEPQDITQWNKDIQVDLVMHGSPCQDFSIAGKQAGGDYGSGTRSSLMYETIRIVNKIKPKYVIWENVKNILSKKHIHNFNAYIETMNNLGYNNYYQVMNAKDYEIPQNRERVFTISIRKDIDKGSFSFPPPKELKIKLKDLLESEVDERYYLSDKMKNYVLDNNEVQKGTKWEGRTENGMLNSNIAHALSVRGACGSQRASVSNFIVDGINEEIKVKDLKRKLCNYLVENDMVKENDVIRHSYTSSRMNHWEERNVESNNISPTLDTRCDCLGVVQKMRIRKLTPKECWRLMGFDDEDFEKASQVNSNAQLYKQAGNSIVVNVLMAIFNELLKKEGE